MGPYEYAGSCQLGIRVQMEYMLSNTMFPEGVLEPVLRGFVAWTRPSTMMEELCA